MKYTVFGIYADNWQRHCSVVVADTPEHAEEVYRAEMGEDMLVAGVIAGDLIPLDPFTYADRME